MDISTEALDMTFTLRERVILYPQFAEALNWVRFHHRRARAQKRGDGMLIIGCSGVGKSTLIEAYIKQFEFECADDATRPVLVIRTPEVPTAKMLVEQMLFAIGDPASHSGSLTVKTERLKRFIRNLGVEMLVFDEFQHFVMRANKARRGEAEDWLKNLISDLSCAVVLVGTPECERLLDDNCQLGRRFSQRIELCTFKNTKTSLHDLSVVLQMLEALMPAIWKDQITSGDIPHRMLYATCGIIDYVVKLLEGAHYLSQINHEGPSLQLLANAFCKFIWRDAKKVSNPFEECFKWRFLTKVGEPFHSIHEVPEKLHLGPDLPLSATDGSSTSESVPGDVAVVDN